MWDTDTPQQHIILYTYASHTQSSFVYVKKVYYNECVNISFYEKKILYIILLELWTFDDTFRSPLQPFVEFCRAPGRMYPYYANIITRRHRRYCSGEPIRSPNGFSFHPFRWPGKTVGNNIRACVRYLYRSIWLLPVQKIHAEGIRGGFWIKISLGYWILIVFRHKDKID